MSELKRMSGETLNLTKENIDKLKELFPEVLTEEQIDFEKLRLILGDEINDNPEKYSFSWNGKQSAIKLAQQPSTGTLRPNKEKSKNWDTTENLYIEGDNLEVLKILQKSYSNKVNIIYIDPPYNTGHDFVYKDNFNDSIDNYFLQTKQTNKEGTRYSTNSESTGRYHTNWLNMMFPRLILARNLLSEDGVIYISIDDNEYSNLKKICDEIFGENNFIASLAVENNPKGRKNSSFISYTHEHLLIYAKNIIKTPPFKSTIKKNDNRTLYTDKYGDYKQGKRVLVGTSSNPQATKNSEKDYDVLYNKKDRTITRVNRNPDREKVLDLVKKDSDYKLYTNRDSKSGELNAATYNWNTLYEHFQNHDLIFKEDTIYQKDRATKSRAKSIWNKSNMSNVDILSETAGRNLRSLLNNDEFSFPKNVNFISELIKLYDDQDALILDFFAGSSTTAHATMQLNSEDRGSRKFIMIQLPELIESSTKYDNISDLGIDRIDKAGSIIEEGKENKVDIGFKVFKLDSSNIQKWNVDSENLEESLFAMENNFVKERSHVDIVYEVLLKLGLDLNILIEESTVDGSTVYNVAFGNLYVVLGENITQEVANHIVIKQKEYENENPTVVFNDNGFMDDNEKLNSVEILKNSGFNEDQLMSI